MVSVLDESVSDAPLDVEGHYIDLFDPHLAYQTKRTLAPNERTLLYDLDWTRRHGIEAKVVAAAARIRNEQLTDEAFRFTAHGPAATTARARVMLPKAPRAINTTPETDFEHTWDADSGTLRLTFPNTAAAITFDVRL